MFNAHHTSQNTLSEIRPPAECTAYTGTSVSDPVHLTTPSAVHLMTCFSPASQHRRLSGEASSSLSPLHRFGFFYIISLRYGFVNSFLKNNTEIKFRRSMPLSGGFIYYFFLNLLYIRKMMWYNIHMTYVLTKIKTDTFFCCRRYAQ